MLVEFFDKLRRAPMTGKYVTICKRMHQDYRIGICSGVRGEPVKILDLAHRMIHLKGYSIKGEDNTDGDIEVEFTGLKRGEKLYEELLVSGDVVGTDHRKIMRAQDGHLPWTELRGALNTLEQACDTFDYDAVKTFIEGLVEGGSLESQLGDLTPRAAVVNLNQANPD